MGNQYIVGDANHNAKVAVEKLREAYWSNDYEKYASQFKQAEEIIISAICHSGFTLIREDKVGDT